MIQCPIITKTTLRPTVSLEPLTTTRCLQRESSRDVAVTQVCTRARVRVVTNVNNEQMSSRCDRSGLWLSVLYWNPLLWRNCLGSYSLFHIILDVWPPKFSSNLILWAHRVKRGPLVLTAHASVTLVAHLPLWEWTVRQNLAMKLHFCCDLWKNYTFLSLNTQDSLN